MRLDFTVSGKPQPKQRARKGVEGRWYTPKPTRDYERSVGMLAAFQRPKGWPRDASYAVEVVCYMPDNRRRDIDNVAKSVLDGCNGILWNDDAQVVRVVVSKEMDKTNPRTVVCVETQGE
jgi:crossover junction endodeoxyribonuclease RusA